MIKQNFRISKMFSLEPVSKGEVKKITKNLKNSKPVGGEIPPKIFKECELTFEILPQCINKSFTSREFPDCLKQANISPIFKKDYPLDKKTTDLLVFFLYVRKCMKFYIITDCRIMQ